MAYFLLTVEQRQQMTADTKSLVEQALQDSSSRQASQLELIKSINERIERNVNRIDQTAKSTHEVSRQCRFFPAQALPLLCILMVPSLTVQLAASFESLNAMVRDQVETIRDDNEIRVNTEARERRRQHEELRGLLLPILRTIRTMEAGASSPDLPRTTPLATGPPTHSSSFALCAHSSTSLSGEHREHPVTSTSRHQAASILVPETPLHVPEPNVQQQDIDAGRFAQTQTDDALVDQSRAEQQQEQLPDDSFAEISARRREKQREVLTETTPRQSAHPNHNHEDAEVRPTSPEISAPPKRKRGRPPKNAAKTYGGGSKQVKQPVAGPSSNSRGPSRRAPATSASEAIEGVQGSDALELPHSRQALASPAQGDQGQDSASTSRRGQYEQEPGNTQDLTPNTRDALRIARQGHHHKLRTRKAVDYSERKLRPRSKRVNYEEESAE